MFNLIVSMIALSLTTLCMFAGVWYGGGLTREAHAKAGAAVLQMQAAEISRATRAFSKDRNIQPGAAGLTAISDLTGSGYLVGVNPPQQLAPAGWNVDFGKMRAWATLPPAASAVCAEAQRSATGSPSVPVNVVDLNGAYAASSAAFGCALFGAAGTAPTFFARI